MKKMTSTEIRNMWIKFFESKGHKLMESAPLVPIDDDSLLWINAGVTPLKKYFDGTLVPENKRIVTIQKCIRTNDIENVGMTKRHQTFFEMMGNFSIGDYFKNEAIEFSFELLTSEEWFAIPKEKIYVTVYPSDIEAYDKWIEVGLDETHIVKLEENFWEIGEGPCGPDSEIFYDRGENYDPNKDALEKFKSDKDQERYIEIWNNVFSQYNSKEGVARSEYKELPSKNIDTGAGLERWACVFQNVDSNFDTDLFQPIIKKIEELSGVLYDGDYTFKVIADHIRAISFALSDNAMFENVGRGYVLRRLLRRSIRMGKKLGLNEPFLYKLVNVVADIMKDSYPNLLEQEARIKVIVLEEEELFHKTLSSGEKRLAELIEENKETKTISGKDAFKLYDTYGFPFELTLEYLNEKNYTTSLEEFNSYMEEQKKLAKQNRKQDTTMNAQSEALLNFKNISEFIYNTYTTTGKVIGLFNNDEKVESIKKEGYIILDKTCFYGEAGGQVGDTGMIIGNSFKARVIDTKKAPNGQNIHKVKLLDGIIIENDEVTCKIDEFRRSSIEKNHSSVHLVQYSLRTLISNQIHQAGSRVDENDLRFDFNYTGKLIDDEIIKVEELVNELINKELEVTTQIMTIEEAKETKAMALFSEKYGNNVRVVSMGESKELCGGTHVNNTKTINKFAIVNIESKGSNVYRLTAVTDKEIESKLLNEIKPYNDEKIKLLMKAKNILQSAKKENIILNFDVEINNNEPISYKDIIFEKNELEYVQNELKNLEKNYKTEKEKLALSDLSQFEKNIEEIKSIKTIIMKTENIESSILKEIVDTLLNKIDTGLIFIANINNDSVNFIARSNSIINAGTLVKEASNKSLGNGGGSPTFAQGGGKTIEFIDEILTNIKNNI